MGRIELDARFAHRSFSSDFERESSKPVVLWHLLSRLWLSGPVSFNSMPYIVGWIVTILTRMLGIVLEALMRDRLDEFNRHSSTPELCSSKKMLPIYHKPGFKMKKMHFWLCA
jgi:hypothetical protein